MQLFTAIGFLFFSVFWMMNLTAPQKRDKFSKPEWINLFLCRGTDYFWQKFHQYGQSIRHVHREFHQIQR